MRFLITGLNGTVAPALADAVRTRGDTVIGWDRREIPIDDAFAVEQYIRDMQPDWFLHVATGSADWSESIALACAKQGVPLLFTGSVSVFAPHQPAPLTPEMLPLAEDDYGSYKRECEQRMLIAYPELIIARLAWQIGSQPGSNTMTDYLAKQAENGPIQASTNWFPACAWLEDTAAAVLKLVDHDQPGIYHLDANLDWSFYQIATHLRDFLGLDWQIEPTNQPTQDNRMHDSQIAMTSLQERLGGE